LTAVQMVAYWVHSWAASMAAQKAGSRAALKDGPMADSTAVQKAGSLVV